QRVARPENPKRSSRFPTVWSYPSGPIACPEGTGENWLTPVAGRVVPGDRGAGGVAGASGTSRCSPIGQRPRLTGQRRLAVGHPYLTCCAYRLYRAKAYLFHMAQNVISDKEHKSVLNRPQTYCPTSMCSVSSITKLPSACPHRAPLLTGTRH